MGLSVKDRGQAVATFRYVHVALMEMLAHWVPTTPEMEAKLLFGEHLWNVAQHADALGKRTHELRLPVQHSLKPVDSYVRLLEEIHRETETAGRIVGLYDALLPGLETRYRDYLERTDSLMDAPTVRILEPMCSVHSHMIQQSRDLRTEFPALGELENDSLATLIERELHIEGLVAP